MNENQDSVDFFGFFLELTNHTVISKSGVAASDNALKNDENNQEKKNGQTFAEETKTK